MQFEAVELDEEPTTLVPERRVVRGSPQAGADTTDAPSLPGRVSLGRPLARPLTAAGVVDDDAELSAFIAAEEDRARYALVYLACTFRPGDGERISTAWLSVHLSVDPPGTDEPIAWSMEPMRTSKPLNVHRTLSIKVPAGFVEAGAEVGTEVTSDALFCEALNLQEPTPSWEFTDSESQRVTGTHRMHLVVRAPLGAVTGVVSLQANVTRHRLGIIPYRAAADGGAPLSFTV